MEMSGAEMSVIILHCRGKLNTFPDLCNYPGEYSSPLLLMGVMVKTMKIIRLRGKSLELPFKVDLKPGELNTCSGQQVFLNTEAV